MIPWIGIALLSASWLFGLTIYHAADGAVWWAVVVVGVLLIGLTRPGEPDSHSKPLTAIAAAAIAPALLLTPMPWRLGLILLCAGLLLGLARTATRNGSPTRRLLANLVNTGILAGSVLVTQALVLMAYLALTARSHDLPAPLAGLLGQVASLLHIENGTCAATVALFTMREHHMLGATWELLVDPVTLCFAAGGIVLMMSRMPLWPWRRRRVLDLVKRIALLLVLIALWLPVRAGLFMAIFLTSVLHTGYDAEPNSVYWLWSSGLHLVSLTIPILLAWRIAPGGQTSPAWSSRPDAATTQTPRPPGAPSAAWLPAGLALAAIFAATAAICWDPVGTRQQGRIVIEEYHPDPEKVWERTDKPFDTEWYGHLSGYNYYCIADYLDHFYDVSRWTEPLNDEALRNCDVLMLKTPTRPHYTDAERAAIETFVRRGGGLLLIGEHTDVFGTSTHLNPVAAMAGITFHDDCLFGIDRVFDQLYIPPVLPHPVVHYIDWMEFATSCSLNVGASPGRAVIRSSGLKNKTADYHVDNFYPPPTDTAEMRYGAFVQLWSTRLGKGRVVAFTDSTIFSNFSIFEPGKSELMMGMVEWLNHKPPPLNPRPWLACLAIALLAGATVTAYRRRTSPLTLIAAGTLGFAAAGFSINAMHRLAMPMPEPRPDRDLVRVVMDRTVSQVILPTNGFIAGKPDGFGIFERWILRLGYFTARREAPGQFAEDVDLLVIPYPAEPVPESYTVALTDFVTRGGRVLIIDSAANETSAANALLAPFDLRVDTEHEYAGLLENTQSWEPVPVTKAVSVRGGSPFAWLEDDETRHVVGTTKTVGSGTVTVIGFGHRFSDQRMGITGDVKPDEDLRKVFDVEYGLIRALIEDRLADPPTSSPHSETE